MRRREESGETEVRLSTLAEDIGVTADLLLPVSRTLVAAGLVNLRDANAFGDGTISTTDLAQKADGPYVMKLFGLG